MQIQNIIDTTRSPRAGEIDGREYNFTTRDDFLRLVAQNGFLEHAQFGGNYYGTSVKAVRDVAEQGRVCVLDIEMEVRVFLNCNFLSPPRPRSFFFVFLLLFKNPFHSPPQSQSPPSKPPPPLFPATHPT